MEFLVHIDVEALLKSIGYLGLFTIIFAESGLIFAFFLPGGSLLFTAGLLASQGIFNILILIPGLWIAAVLGDNIGYWFGSKVGPKIFTKKDSLFFHQKHLEKTKNFFNKYGSRTIVLARFFPFVRTFAPILAGVGKMNYQSFIKFNMLGALLWAVGVTSLGFFLGSTVPGIDQFIVPIILGIIFLTLLPLIKDLVSSRRKNNQTKTP